jgi:hypothetical protein
MHPGDLIEWWCKNPFNGETVPYECDQICICSGSYFDWRAIPARGVQMVISMDHEYITWLSGDRLYSEKLSELRGGFEHLTGSVHVFPRAVKI